MKGEGIHWEDLDEDISVEHLLAGYPSMESQESLRRWLEARKEREVQEQHAPNSGEFSEALRLKLQEAAESGLSYIDINSGKLHRAVGGYPKPTPRMPICCAVMRKEMRSGDSILAQPPKGNGANLTIRYQLPRK